MMSSTDKSDLNLIRINLQPRYTETFGFNSLFEYVFHRIDYVSRMPAPLIELIFWICRKREFTPFASAMNSQPFRIKSFIWISKWDWKHR